MDLSNLSKSANAGLSTEGEQMLHSGCAEQDAYHDEHILYTDQLKPVSSSEQRLAQASWRTLPANNGAPSNVASSMLTLLNKRNVGSVITDC